MRRRWFTFLLLVGSTLLLTAADVAYRRAKPLYRRYPENFVGRGLPPSTTSIGPQNLACPWPSNKKNLLTSSIPPLN